VVIPMMGMDMALKFYHGFKRQKERISAPFEKELLS